MEYFVIGADGAEYGPASIETLKGWVTEQRVLPTTMLKSVSSGLTVAASTVSGLFPTAPPVSGPERSYAPPTANWSQPPNHYPRAGAGSGGPSPKFNDDGKMDIVWALFRSALAIAFLFIEPRGYFSIIVGAYSIVYAYRAKEKGHRLGTAALGIAIGAFVIVLIGCAIRYSQMGSASQ